MAKRMISCSVASVTRIVDFELVCCSLKESKQSAGERRVVWLLCVGILPETSRNMFCITTKGVVVGYSREVSCLFEKHSGPASPHCKWHPVLFALSSLSQFPDCYCQAATTCMVGALQTTRLNGGGPSTCTARCYWTHIIALPNNQEQILEQSHGRSASCWETQA